MKAIITKYHAPGNVRSTRCSASDLDGNRVYVPALAATDHDNHAAACAALCAKMGWHGTLAEGYLQKGRVWVFVRSGERNVARTITL